MKEHCLMARLCLIGILTVMSLPASAAGRLIDDVMAICVDRKRPPHICQCASKKLKKEAEPGAYALYDQMAGFYRKARGSGLRVRPAWSRANKQVATQHDMPVATLADQIEVISDQHHQAMQACGVSK